MKPVTPVLRHLLSSVAVWLPSGCRLVNQQIFPNFQIHAMRFVLRIARIHAHKASHALVLNG